MSQDCFSRRARYFFGSVDVFCSRVQHNVLSHPFISLVYCGSARGRESARTSLTGDMTPKSVFLFACHASMSDLEWRLGAPDAAGVISRLAGATGVIAPLEATRTM